ncbi:hypothetical protein CH274_24550 [Rhodococcus sp. 06-418-5]|nr:hypothetical protein CH274_24550 [Rhodococcus sp. 06-418-5]
MWLLDNLTQPAATVIASLGIIVAALITFAIGYLSRRQLDRHHKATHTLADTQALRDRFTTITGQLADPAPAIRTAAVSALEALADDWLDRDKPRETQACINVFCDYLRTPYKPPTRNPHLRKQTRRTHRTKFDYTDTTHEYPHDDLDTRHAIVRTIAAHLQKGHVHGWSAFDFDLTGAYLHEVNFSGATFSGQDTSFEGATFSGAYATFVLSTFNSVRTTFRGATFGSEYSTLFSGATFNGRHTLFDRATFGSELTGFLFATFSGRDTSFEGATFSGQDTLFECATFRGKNTSFEDATFSGKNITFENPKKWVNVLVDWERGPESAFGPLPPQPESVRPHEWPPVPESGGLDRWGRIESLD